jgi:hypothetical protein
MSGPPDVDYRSTSARPAWITLPEQLRQSLTVALGTELLSVGPSVTSGFTGGFAAPAQLTNGRLVFIKAAPENLHAHSAYQREAQIVPQLPPELRVPQILATTTTRPTGGVGGTPAAGSEGAAAGGGEQGWFAVVSEGVTGRMPGMPWTQADFELVTANCVTIAEALSPSPLKDLKPFTDDFGECGPSQIADEIRRGDRLLPQGFQYWLPDRLEEIQHLVDLTPETLSGTAAVHGDLRPDNLLIDKTDQCWTVDWNWLTLGAPWIDWVCLLPLAQHQGIDTLTAIKNYPLTIDVANDHIDSLIAALMAYVLEVVDRPPPPGCTPEIQRHRRLLGWCCLEWLALRRGW